MKRDINGSIEELKEEIEEKEEQIKLLQQLDVHQVLTEKEWHKICLTPLRNSDLMGNFLLNIFPDAKDIDVGINYIKFKLYEFKCKIPKSVYEEIRVDTSWRKNLKEPALENSLNFTSRNMREYFKILDSNGSWLKLFDLRFPKHKYYSKYRKFILWFCVYKWKDVNREEWQKKFTEEEKIFEKKLEKYLKEKQEQEKKEVIFKEKLFSTLHQFTDTIIFED